MKPITSPAIPQSSTLSIISPASMPTELRKIPIRIQLAKKRWEERKAATNQTFHPVPVPPPLPKYEVPDPIPFTVVSPIKGKIASIEKIKTQKNEDVKRSQIQLKATSSDSESFTGTKVSITKALIRLYQLFQRLIISSICYLVII